MRSWARRLRGPRVCLEHALGISRLASGRELTMKSRLNASLRAVMREVMSARRRRAEGPKGPSVSRAKGSKVILSPREEYFVFLRSSAAAAAAPGELGGACK